MQKQVHELIDYLIQKDLAKNIIITLLTNASKYPIELIEKFKLFKDVFYTISIDGVGDVIEYQRRGADWKTVEENALKLWESMGCTINYVLTAVNVFSILDFISWLTEHKINDKIFISLVFNKEYLSIAAIPPELRNPLLNKLQLARSVTTMNQDIIDRVLEIFDQIEYQPLLLLEFLKYIKIEDAASKKTLVEVIPEWTPYFK
jgi:MoaA/NifB/PqqE/SkfB family radical SAM enzyme